VVEERLGRDDAGHLFLELIAERDYAEAESLPDHQLEHTLDRERDDTSAAAAAWPAQQRLDWRSSWSGWKPA
jgi:hypothetical protein